MCTSSTVCADRESSCGSKGDLVKIGLSWPVGEDTLIIDKSTNL